MEPTSRAQNIGCEKTLNLRFLSTKSHPKRITFYSYFIYYHITSVPKGVAPRPSRSNRRPLERGHGGAVPRNIRIESVPLEKGQLPHIQLEHLH